MFSFFSEAISLSFYFLSVYFLLFYSLGITFLFLIHLLGSSLLLFALLLCSVLILYLRSIVQNRFQHVVRKHAIDFKADLFTYFVLSFSLSIHLFSIFSPGLRQDLIQVAGGYKTDMAVMLAKYLLSAVVGVVIATIILIILKRHSGWSEKKLSTQSIVLLSIVGMFAISLSGSVLSGTNGGWYGIPEDFLVQLGYYSFGSIPIFLVRLLVFGDHLKKK